MSEPKIQAFHVNNEAKSIAFVEGNQLIAFEDKYYLGNGMYFWDNKGNANYWLDKKKSEGLKPIHISECEIDLSKPVLDMTDCEVISRVEQLWTKYCNKTEESIEQPIGIIIDKLFLSVPKVFSEMKVAKAHGRYNSRFHTHNLLKSLGSSAFIDNSPKTIYCVRCISKIFNKKTLYIYK